MHKLLCAALAAVALLCPNFANAAIIGPTDDWQPLVKGARALGISGTMVKRILAAGVELSCPGTLHKNGGALNGWFLGTDLTSFYTNAHGIIDIGRTDHKSNFIEPLDQCSVRSYADLVNKGERATAYQLALPQNRMHIAMATFTPQHAPPSADRARLRLLRSIAGAKALALPDFSRIKPAVGEEVIMVSMQPPAMRDPAIQACHVQSLNLRRAGPGQLFTDCDNNFGNSAALYFVRDPADRSMLLPIALHEGCHEKLGDGKSWNLEDNTAVGIMLERNFFTTLRGES